MNKLPQDSSLSRVSQASMNIEAILIIFLQARDKQVDQIK